MTMPWDTPDPATAANTGAPAHGGMPWDTPAPSAAANTSGDTKSSSKRETGTAGDFLSAAGNAISGQLGGIRQALTELGAKYPMETPQADKAGNASVWGHISRMSPMLGPLGGAASMVGNLAGEGAANPQLPQQLRQQQDAINQQMAPTLNTTAGQWGNFAGNLAASAPFMATGAGVIPAIAGGALAGATQPVGTNDSRGLNAATGAGGALVGNVVGGALGRLVTPVGHYLSEAQKRSIALLKEHGIDLDAMQATGSRALLKLRGVVEDSPSSAQIARDFENRQQEHFNNEALKIMGIDKDPETAGAAAATSGVITKTQQRLSGNYNAIAARNQSLLADPQMRAEWGQTMRQAQHVLKPEDFSRFQRLEDILNEKAETQPPGSAGFTTVNNIVHTPGTPGQPASAILGPNGQPLRAATPATPGSLSVVHAPGHIDFEQFQTIKTALDDISAEGGSVGKYARDLRTAFRSNLERQSSPEDAQLLRDTNKEWYTKERIEEAVANNPKGDISPARLFDILGKKQNGRVTMHEDRGHQDLANLARAGKMILGEKGPNSGTPTRRLMLSLAPSAIGAGYEGLSTGDWRRAGEFGGAELVGGYLLAPKLAAHALYGPLGRKYLSEGIGSQGFQRMVNGPLRGALRSAGVATGMGSPNIQQQLQDLQSRYGP